MDFTAEEIIEQTHKKPHPKARRFFNHWNISKPYQRLECDLLFLTTDKGYRYCLTCIDVASRYKWGQPVKNKKPSTVLEAFKKMKIPYDKVQVVATDDGGEFKSVFSKFIKSKNIEHHINEPGVHLSFVESFNGNIAKKLYKIQEVEELKSGKPNSDWVDDLDDVIKDMNNSYTRLIKMKPIDAVDMVSVLQPKNNWSKADIKKKHPIGAIVRRLLRPDEIETAYLKRVGTGADKLHSRRRKTDALWSHALYKVVANTPKCSECLIYHGLQDVETDEIYFKQFTYWQLQVVG